LDPFPGEIHPLGQEEKDRHFDSRLGLVYPAAKPDYTGKDWYTHSDPADDLATLTSAP
jgi:hypothetical protein